MLDLSLGTLRAANVARIPQFTNRHGQPAHSKPDGSDWTPAQWLQALVGEIGEFAEARLKYEVDGMAEEYGSAASKELADVQTYLDIVALRSLDTVPQLESAEQADAAQRFMVVMSNLGQYANLRKKLDRGDVDLEEFNHVAPLMLNAAIQAITMLMVNGPANAVVEPHAEGVHLGMATADKFNEVSERVKSTVRLLTVSEDFEAFQLFRKGAVLRYGGNPHDLMVVRQVVVPSHGLPSYSGVSCLGGFITVPDECLLEASGADLAVWDEHYVQRLASGLGA